jgi:hypothetical protein
VAEIGVPPGIDDDELAGDIEATAGELGVDVTFRPIDTDTL